MSDAALAAAGIHPGTVRLSIGLEDIGDLLEDIDRGLAAARKAWRVAARSSGTCPWSRSSQPKRSSRPVNKKRLAL